MDTGRTSLQHPCGRVILSRYATQVTYSPCPLGGPGIVLGSEGRSHAMRAYELMVIISGKLDESAAHSWIKTISASVAGVGGQIHGTPDWWGKRRLAYPIMKQDDGYYAIFNLSAEGGALDEVERGFRLSDDVLRHKLLRLPDDEAARRGMISAA